ncbi:BON domain-containing protein [Lysobacter brunescens]|uniref:BON domain-containing protein n=1 Tax=Lysobacter brunescens TaxID=262323 RepID=A0ABW2Y8J9_9GAMM
MSQRFTNPRSSSRMLAIGAALAMSLAAPLAIAADGAATQTKAHESSQQPVEDSWITTKVKADLLVDEQTKGLDINVSTTNGVVTLAGRLDSTVQVDKAVSIARGIKGVKSVDATTLTVKPRG